MKNKIFALIYENKKATSAGLARDLGLEIKDIRWALKELIAEGKIWLVKGSGDIDKDENCVFTLR